MFASVNRVIMEENMKRFLITALAGALCWTALPTFISCKKQAESRTRYEITAEYVPETRTLTGAVKLTFENPTERELKELKLQLYPNAYRENALYKPVSATYENAAYYKGASYGSMAIYSVHGSKNWELTGEDENILTVFLERSLFPGERVVLDIGFMTKLAEVNHRTGVTEKTVSLGSFFPILCGIRNGSFVETVYYSDGDPFYSDCADYKVTLTAPKEYVVVSGGELVEERMLESKKEYTMSALNVRDFALALSTVYRVERVDVGDTTLEYYYYADTSPKKTLTLVEECFTFYEKTFGAYPYPKYSLCETGLCLGGQEYPCMSLLSDSLQNEARIRAVAHEVAHQWWYGVVGSDQLENAWQDEGLSEYSALAFFEAYEKYGVTREGMVKDALAACRAYSDVYGSVLGRADMRMTRHLKEYLSEYEYECMSYDKAVVMFDALRKSVGDEKFFASLKKYYKSCAYKQATVGELVGSFERSGLDVAGFFDSFLNGRGVL